MTRDDIIRMAREAGIVVTGEAVWKLCELVAAAEREKLAAWMTDRSYATGHGDTTEDLLKELEWQVRESEREACAKLCEQWEWANNAAAAIRARGQQ
jgi:hypothetical protein